MRNRPILSDATETEGVMVPQRPYNRGMAVHVIGNPVPTPEEMGEILGLSPDRVKAIRRIMSTPVRAKKSDSANTVRKACLLYTSPSPRD